MNATTTRLPSPRSCARVAAAFNGHNAAELALRFHLPQSMVHTIVHHHAALQTALRQQLCPPPQPTNAHGLPIYSAVIGTDTGCTCGQSPAVDNFARALSDDFGITLTRAWAAWHQFDAVDWFGLLQKDHAGRTLAAQPTLPTAEPQPHGQLRQAPDLTSSTSQ